MPHEEEFDVSGVSEDLDDDDDGEGSGANGTIANGATASAPAPERRRIPKPRLKKQGLGAVERPRFNFQEAELLWTEILNYLPKLGKSPYDLCCRVSRLAPEKMLVGTAFECSAIAPSPESNISPSDALLEYVTDNYHHQITQGSMRYDLTFAWKVGGDILTRGTLHLPPMAETLAFRRQRAANAQKIGNGAIGMGSPPMQQAPQYQPSPPQQQPQWAPMPQSQTYGQVYAPQQQQQQQQPSHDMNELAYLRGVLTEAISASRENRAPVIQPPPVAAPPAGLTRKDVAEVVVEVMQAMGVAPKAVGVGAPPPTVQAPSQFVSGFKSFVQQAKEFKEAGKLLAGVFDEGDEEPDAAATPAPIVEAKPEDTLPFVVSAVPGAKWADGTDVQYAASRETGGIDWMGVAMSNPHAATKAMEYAGKIMETGAAALAKFAGLRLPDGGATEVVSQVPTAALNAGVGQVTQPQPQPATKKDGEGGMPSI